MTVLDLQSLAERLAPLYVNDYVGVAKLCDETIDRSGKLLGLVRTEAAKIGLPSARQKAREVLERLCSDPEMWGTHGCPAEEKMKRLEDELTAAFDMTAERERCAKIADGLAEFVGGESHERLCHTIAAHIRTD